MIFCLGANRSAMACRTTQIDLPENSARKRRDTPLHQKSLANALRNTNILIPALFLLAILTILVNNRREGNSGNAVPKPFAQLSTDLCDFGDISLNTTHTQQVTLSVNVPMDTAKIRLMPTHHPALTWKLTPTSKGNLLITIQLGTLKEPGIFSALLTVAFPNERTLTLPVLARCIR